MCCWCFKEEWLKNSWCYYANHGNPELRFGFCCPDCCFKFCLPEWYLRSCHCVTFSYGENTEMQRDIECCTPYHQEESVTFWTSFKWCPSFCAKFCRYTCGLWHICCRNGCGMCSRSHGTTWPHPLASRVWERPWQAFCSRWRLSCTV